MSLASFEDANGHLDGTKIKFVDADDASSEASNADRYIEARLVNTFPDYIELWDYQPTGDQEETPGIVALAASLLMAAERYRKMYSLEDTSASSFPNSLATRADMILDGLVAGTINIPGLTDDDYQHIQQTDFWPNDTTRVMDPLNVPVGLKLGDQLRFATMDREF